MHLVPCVDYSLLEQGSVAMVNFNWSKLGNLLILCFSVSSREKSSVLCSSGISKKSKGSCMQHQQWA